MKKLGIIFLLLIVYGHLAYTQCTVTITSTNVTCFGFNDGQATADPTGPVGSTATYRWSRTATPLITLSTSQTIVMRGPGSYTVTVTYLGGCSNTATTLITEPAPLSLSIATLTPIACAGGTGALQATGSGGSGMLKFQWANGPMNATYSNIPAGTYLVTLTDENNCTISTSRTLTQPAALNVALNPSGPIRCFGNTVDSILAMPTGGTGNYTYKWSGIYSANTGNKIQQVSAGNYTVTITDINNCTATKTIAVTQPPALAVSVIVMQDTATATASGGTGNLTYHWSNGVNAAQITGLAAGLYRLTVTDGNACTQTATALITSPANCTVKPVYAITTPAQVCGNMPFTLEAVDSFPNMADVHYIWFLPNGDSIVTTLPELEVIPTSSEFSGEYFVLRDSLACRSITVGGATVNIITLQVFAGNDTVLCSAGTVNLKATLPAMGTGSWLSLGGATIDNSLNAITIGRNLQPGANAFVWQVSLNNCPQAATDTVVYFLESAPVVGDDRYVLYHAYDVAVMEILLNDALAGLTDTLLLQIGEPASGQLELLAGRRFRYTAEEDFRGKVAFQYAVCSPNAVCNLPCDTAKVTIDVLNMPVVPEGLVLNDPGPNGRLTILGITGFTRVEITITDRWGDVVFQQKEYSNTEPWLGNYKDSQQGLPKGAYYYFLRAYDGTQQIGQTLTGVIHLFEE